MPQSLAAVLVHVIFSTKNREPFIQPGVEAELYPYLATACKSAESPALAIGGTADHVHCSRSSAARPPSPISWKRSNRVHRAGSKRKGRATRASIGKPATARFPSANRKFRP